MAGLGIVLLLAAPTLSMRLGFTDAGNDPAGTQTRQAYDLLSEGFGPGFNGPLRPGGPAAARRRQRDDAVDAA